MSWEGRPWVGILKVGVRALRWLLMGGDMGTERPSCFWAFSVDPEGEGQRAPLRSQFLLTGHFVLLVNPSRGLAARLSSGSERSLRKVIYPSNSG